MAIDEKIFLMLLDGAIAAADSALVGARGLDALGSTPRDFARQMRMNRMVEDQIINLIEISNVNIAWTHSQTVNGVPFPPMIKRDITLCNLRNAMAYKTCSVTGDPDEVMELGKTPLANALQNSRTPNK